MPSTVTVKCKNPGCNIEFEARVVDRKRGWGKFCSKSCKAIAQERRTHQHSNYKMRKKIAMYQEEYGGTPVFSRKGEYEGFFPGQGDVSESQE